MDVAFVPTAAGPRAGTLTINTSQGLFAIPLTGNGAAPIPAFTPSSIVFVTQATGTASPAQTITLSNNGAGKPGLPGNKKRVLLDVAVRPGYVAAAPGIGRSELALIATNNCGDAVSSSCSIQVTFAPANSGLRTGTLTVDFGSTSPAQTVALTGQGSGASYQAAPSSVFFGDQQTQTSSSAQLISLFPFNFNSQLLINAIWISGDFSQTNNCALPPSPPTGVACTLNVVFTPTAVGPRTGSIIISSNQGTLTIPLSGNGVTTAIPVLSTNDLVFPDQGDQTSCAAQVVTLTNNGNGTLQIQGFGVSGDFSVTPSAACATAQNLDPGQSCTYSIVFTPQVAGIRAGSFSLQTNGGSVGVTLTGSGVIGVASVSPQSLSFAAQVVQTASSAQTITLSNTGGLPVTVTSIAASGDFSQTNNCGTSLAPGTTCSISVIFTPSATGTRSGSLAIATNAGNNSLSASLAGIGGVAMAAISSGALSFGNQLVGTTGAAQLVTLTNTGNISITISGITISGDFAQTNACGSTLSPGAACIISVTFTPTTRFSRAGVLSIQSNATPPAANVSLGGTGIAPVPAFTPASAGFGNQRVGTSASQTLTLTNNGDAALSENGFSIAGASGFTQTTNCPSSLSPGANCSVIVTFMPLSRGTKTATLSLNTQQPFTASAALSGTGIAPVAALTAGLSFAPQIVRTTTTQTAVLANNGDASLAIASISITGDFAQSNTCPATLAPAASCSIQVSFTPTASGARSGSLTVSDDDPASPAQTTALSGTGLDYSVTASLGSVTVRAGSTALYTVTATALGGNFPNSVNLSCSGLPTSGTCTFSPAAISPGGGSSSSSLQITTGSGQHGTKKTPAGTYIITIGGASGSLSHTTSVTLIVQ